MSWVPLPRPLVQSEPSAAPQGVSCESSSSTSLRVNWKPPPTEGQNGELAGYELRYQRVSGAEGGGQGQDVKALPIPGQQGQTVLEGLEKWSWYNISLAAFTSEGTGPNSPVVICRTDEDGKSESNRSDSKSIDCLVHGLLARLPVTNSVFGWVCLCGISAGCSPSSGGCPAAQLLGPSSHLAVSFAAVTAGTDPWVPSAFQPRRKRRIPKSSPDQRPLVG